MNEGQFPIEQDYNKLAENRVYSQRTFWHLKFSLGATKFRYDRLGDVTDVTNGRSQRWESSTRAQTRAA